MTGFIANAPVIWPRPADWGSSVRETLSWSTEVLQASSGVTVHRSLRFAPRRSFSFDAVADSQERRVIDALMREWSGRRWLLPIWPDQQMLAAPVAAGALSIPCRTEGYDFVAGGRAVLWASITRWEVVHIEAIDVDGFTLSMPLGGAWRRGTRLLPLRWARMDANSSIRTITDTLDRPRMSFTIDESCDWPEQLPATQYRGHPVLTIRPDFGEDGEIGYSRLLSTVDNGTAMPVVTDIAGVPQRTVRSVWELWGRAEQAAFRSLLYGLRGRAQPLWVPSWQQDFRLVLPATASATFITVEWAGYSLFGAQQPNRRDIAIHLVDGTILYRRITASVDLGGTERLTLDAPLSRAIAPAQVRAISFMVLCTQASDQVDIEHITGGDGRARCIVPWQEVVPDGP